MTDTDKTPFVSQDNRNPSYYTMRGCTHVSIPVGGSDDSGVDNNEEQFLSGWFMEPNGYDGDEDNVAETDGKINIVANEL